MSIVCVYNPNIKFWKDWALRKQSYVKYNRNLTNNFQASYIYPAVQTVQQFQLSCSSTVIYFRMDIKVANPLRSENSKIPRSLIYFNDSPYSFNFSAQKIVSCLNKKTTMYLLLVVAVPG